MNLMAASRWAWILAMIAVVGVILFLLLYSFASYDACLDRINYDRARWHECD